jgi:hypothetical protein
MMNAALKKGQETAETDALSVYAAASPKIAENSARVQATYVGERAKELSDPAIYEKEILAPNKKFLEEAQAGRSELAINLSNRMIQRQTIGAESSILTHIQTQNAIAETEVRKAAVAAATSNFVSQSDTFAAVGLTEEQRTFSEANAGTAPEVAVRATNAMYMDDVISATKSLYAKTGTAWTPEAERATRAGAYSSKMSALLANRDVNGATKLLGEIEQHEPNTFKPEQKELARQTIKKVATGIQDEIDLGISTRYATLMLNNDRDPNNPITSADQFKDNPDFRAARPTVQAQIIKSFSADANPLSADQANWVVAESARIFRSTEGKPAERAALYSELLGNYPGIRKTEGLPKVLEGLMSEDSNKSRQELIFQEQVALPMSKKNTVGRNDYASRLPGKTSIPSGQYYDTKSPLGMHMATVRSVYDGFMAREIASGKNPDEAFSEFKKSKTWTDFQAAKNMKVYFENMWLSPEQVPLPSESGYFDAAQQKQSGK